MKYISNYKIFEIHYKAKFNDEFQEFRKKWNKYKSGYTYWVQFSNFKSDKLDKSIHNSPDHTDPIGNYAYPLRYVIDYPMDIWYGSDAKYLRVLENKAKNILYLNEIKTKDDCLWEMSNIFPGNLRDMEEMIKPIRKYHSNRVSGSNKWAKTFFQMLQVEYSDEHEDGFRIRSGEEQTKMLLKAGYDAIIDESRSINSAIINDREPNQIIFLKPTSFKVIEVYNLGGKGDSYVVSKDYNKFGRKILSKVLNIMDGDKIKNSGSKSLSETTFYTVDGRKAYIEVSEDDTSYRNDIKIGQKPHKLHKLHDGHSVKINIETEYGDFHVKMYSDEELKDFLNDVETSWKNFKENNEKDVNFEPRTIERDKKIEDDQKNAYYKKKREEEYQQRLARYDHFMDSINFWSEEYDIPLDMSDKEIVIKYIGKLDGFDRRLSWTMDEEQVNNHLDDEIDMIKGEKYDGGRFWLEIEYGEDSDENEKNAINFVNLIRRIFLDNVTNGNTNYLKQPFYSKEKSPK